VIISILLASLTLAMRSLYDESRAVIDALNGGDTVEAKRTSGGVPLAMAYKAVNTLDSMVGYKNDKYRDIGAFSAKMDDIFNWIPARSLGLLL
jgi:cobalamin biosynthesis protein CobD/CbiB